MIDLTVTQTGHSVPVVVPCRAYDFGQQCGEDLRTWLTVVVPLEWLDAFWALFTGAQIACVSVQCLGYPPLSVSPCVVVDISGDSSVDPSDVRVTFQEVTPLRGGGR